MAFARKKVVEPISGDTTENSTISVSEIRTSELTFFILGTTPIVLNRLSEKAKRELLLPKRKTNRAGLEQTLKHDPLEEYRASVYQNKLPNAPTRILLHGGAFKRALADAALDMPGAAKATIGRLTGIKETMLDLYGVPELMMAVVRQAGIVKSPDIRTRAVIRDWACKVTVSYVSSVLSREDVTHLLAAAGIIIGVGDWRPQKGAGSFGQFRLCNHDDPTWNAIVKNGRTGCQDEALAEPTFYDADTEDLILWYLAEVKRRASEPETKVKKARVKRASNGGDEEEGLFSGNALNELEQLVENRL